MNNKRNSFEESPTRVTRAQKQQKRNGAIANAAVLENGIPVNKGEVNSPANPAQNSAWENPTKVGKIGRPDPEAPNPNGNNQFNPLVINEDSTSDSQPNASPLVNSNEEQREGEPVSSPGQASSGNEDDESWRREESDGEGDIDLDDATWSDAFQDAMTTVFWFSVFRIIPNNSSTGWATYIAKVTKIPFVTLEGITKIVKNGSVIIENNGLSEEWINRLKELNTDHLAYSPGESVSDAEATLLAYVAKTNDKLSNIEVASNGMHMLNKMAEKKNITIDKIVTRFVENAKFPCFFLIFKKVNDAFRIFEKGTGKCDPLYDEKLGVIVKPIPETLRCMNKLNWRKLSVKDIGYSESIVIDRMKEFSAFEKYHNMIGMICHNKNFKTGVSTRNATIIAKPKLIFKMAEVIREKKPKGIGLKGANATITAELVLDERHGNKGNK